jgi:hypothetical protein
MTDKSNTRFEIVLPAARRAALEKLAAESGWTASALTRLAIGHLLSHSDLLLTGGSTTPGGDLGAFLAELRAIPPRVGAADQLEKAFSDLDTEAGINRDAAGLFECLSIVARARGPIEKRLRVMLELLNHEGKVLIPRALLNPNRTSA